MIYPLQRQINYGEKRHVFLAFSGTKRLQRHLPGLKTQVAACPTMNHGSITVRNHVRGPRTLLDIRPNPILCICIQNCVHLQTWNNTILDFLLFKKYL